MKHLITIFSAIAILGMSVSSCEKDVKPTSVLVLDSIRHYYPVLQGKELAMVWRIANIGKSPLVITDIMPSCGCICTEEDDGMVIAPGKEAALHFTFLSDKYTGYVSHEIRLYGNIAPLGVSILRFDTNVVPSYNSSPDYEEYYKADRVMDWKDIDDRRRSYEVDNPDRRSFSQKYFFDLDSKK